MRIVTIHHAVSLALRRAKKHSPQANFWAAYRHSWPVFQFTVLRFVYPINYSGVLRILRLLGYIYTDDPVMQRSRH